MNTPRKLYLGVVTLWPTVYSLVVLLVKKDGGALASLLEVLQIPTGLLILSMLIFYIVNILKNELLSTNKKIIWTVLLFLFGLFLMPVYWYRYIWSEPGSPSAVPVSEPSPVDETQYR